MNEEIFLNLPFIVAPPEFNGKLLRRNSPFLPYSIRIEIIEYLEVSFPGIDADELNIFFFFGYFKSDMSRMIFQVFRCLRAMVIRHRNSGIYYDMIPPINTKSLSFAHVLDALLNNDNFFKRDFSKFQNLMKITFISQSGICQNLLTALSKIPKLKKIRLEERHSMGLVGLEVVCERFQRSLKKIELIYLGPLHSEDPNFPAIDYFEKKLHLVRGHVLIRNYSVKGRNSFPDGIHNDIFLHRCVVDGNFFRSVGNNNIFKNDFIMNIQHCEIRKSIEHFFNENTLLSLLTSSTTNQKRVFNAGDNYHYNSRFERINIPTFCVVKTKEHVIGNHDLSDVLKFTKWFGDGMCITVFGSGEERNIVFPDEFVNLLNSFRKLFIICVNGKLAIEEVLKVKISELKMLILLKKNVGIGDNSQNSTQSYSKMEIDELKKNNPKLNFVVCMDLESKTTTEL